MSNIERFLDYVEAFDRACETGAWAPVEDFFTEDAVFESLAAPPMDGRYPGREAIIERFRTSVAGFDNRFDTRSMRFLDGPKETEGVIRARFEARYSVDGAPDLSFEGQMRVEFTGDRIRFLEDTIAAEQTDALMLWFRDHIGKLRPDSPVDRPDKGPAIVMQPADGIRYELAAPAAGHALVKLGPANCAGNAFSMGTQILPPEGTLTERCYVRGEAVYYVQSGAGHVLLDGETHAISQGSTIVAGRGVAHSIVNESPGDMELVWLSFPPGTERLLQSQATQPQQSATESDDWFRGPATLASESYAGPKGQSLVIGRDEAPSYWQASPNDGYVNIIVSPYNYSSNQFSMGSQTMAPHTVLVDHSHTRHEELLYVLDGRATAYVDGERIDIERGSLLFAGRYVKHGIRNETDQPMTMLWVFLPPDLETLLSAAGQLRTPGEPMAEPLYMAENMLDLLDLAGFAPM